MKDTWIAYSKFEHAPSTSSCADGHWKSTCCASGCEPRDTDLVVTVAARTLTRSAGSSPGITTEGLAPRPRPHCCSSSPVMRTAHHDREDGDIQGTLATGTGRPAAPRRRSRRRDRGDRRLHSPH